MADEAREERKKRQKELMDMAKQKREAKDLALVFKTAKMHEYNEYTKTHLDDYDQERKFFELFDDENDMLVYFDNSKRYGPLHGITRIQRYTQAVRFGLEPPIEIKLIMDRDPEAANKIYIGA